MQHKWVLQNFSVCQPFCSCAYNWTRAWSFYWQRVCMTEVAHPVLHSPPFDQKVRLFQNFPQGISIGNFELNVFCFVASNGPGSVCWCIPHNWSKMLGDISSMKVRDWEKGKKVIERGTEKEKKARKRVIERGLRPVEIHHNVRPADILRPHIHHCSRIWRHQWTQETGDEEWSEGR